MSWDGDVGSEGVVVVPEDGDAGQWGERRRRECPAKEVIGMSILDDGKRVRWTWGVQAPAARTRRLQGRVISREGEAGAERFAMRMLSRMPEAVRETERAWAGW